MKLKILKFLFVLFVAISSASLKAQNCNIILDATSFTDLGGGNYSVNPTITNFNYPTGSILWNIFDVNFSNESFNPTIHFQNNGSYNIQAILKDSINNCFDTASFTLVISNLTNLCNIYINPINFTTYSSPPLDYGFSSYLNVNTNASQKNYFWEISQGASIIFTSASSVLNNTNYLPVNFDYSFTNVGTYTVSLIVTSNLGTCGDTSSIVINADPNTCNLTSSFTYSQVNGSFTFDFVSDLINPTSTTYHFNTSPFYYPIPMWYTQPNTSITFAIEGNYRIYHLALDTIPNGYCMDTSSQVISVDACRAQFNVIVDSLNGINTIYDESLGGIANVNSYWDMGDGITYPYSPNQSFTHDYAVSGAYSVCLYVTNGGLCNDTYCTNINAFRTADNAKQTLLGLNRVVVNPNFAGLKPNQNTLYHISPNPTNGKCKVNTNNNFFYSVFNGQGTKIKQTVSLTNEINIDEFANGIYFIQVYNANNELIIGKKIIKN